MMRRAIRVLAIPWIMIIAVVGFSIVGVYVDRLLGTSPLMLIIMVVLAVAGAGYQCYRLILKVLED